MSIETVAIVELDIDGLEVDELQVEDWEDQYLLENRSLDGFEEWLEEEKLPEWAMDMVVSRQADVSLHRDICVSDVNIHG